MSEKEEFRSKLCSFIEKETETIEKLVPFLLNGASEEVRLEFVGKVKILKKIAEWVEKN